MPREDEEDDGSDEDKEDGEKVEEEEDDTFVCRLCGKTTDVGDGEETFALCDKCAKDYDIDKMWDDFDAEIISGSNARTVSLDKYRIRKGPAKTRGPAKRSW